MGKGVVQDWLQADRGRKSLDFVFLRLYRSAVALHSKKMPSFLSIRFSNPVRHCLAGLSIFLAFSAIASAKSATDPEHRFEKAVRGYEAADKIESPKQGAILLVGDSQFFVGRRSARKGVDEGIA